MSHKVERHEQEGLQSYQEQPTVWSLGSSPGAGWSLRWHPHISSVGPETMRLLATSRAASFSRLASPTTGFCSHSFLFFFFLLLPESKCQDDSTFSRGIVLLACSDKDWCIAWLHPQECIGVWNNEQQSLQSFQTPHKKGRSNPRYLSLSSQDCRGFKKNIIVSISYPGNNQWV